jgi:hypothetical protein
MRAGLLRLFPKVMGNATHGPCGRSFMPETAYERRLPSPEYTSIALKREMRSSSSSATSSDEGQCSEAEFVAVFSKFNTKAVPAAFVPDMGDVNRSAKIIRELKPLPPLPEP